MNPLDDIMNAVRAASANVLFDGAAVTCVKRKLPKSEETVDQPIQVTVSGQELVDRATRIAFNARWKKIYLLLVTLITPSNRDAAWKLAEHAKWRFDLQAVFQAKTPLALPVVEQVDVVEAPFLDTQNLLAGYDYNQVALEIVTYEDKS